VGVAASAGERRLPAMLETDSRLSAVRLREVRALLATPPTGSESLAGVIAAAAFFAITALALAGAVVMMPSPWPT
jgi:hypothetical protein